MHWTEATIHVMDFEGTRKTGILEYGIVTIEKGRVAQVYTRLCAPTGRFEAQDMFVHGIEETALQGRETVRADRELFVSLRNSGPFCAHHASVEEGLLKKEWPYPGWCLNFYDKQDTGTHEWGPWLDTRRLAEAFDPKRETCQLNALLEEWHLTEPLQELARKYCPPARCKPHCALYDALGSCLVLLFLLNQTDWSDSSLHTLLSNSASTHQKKEKLMQPRLFDG